MFSCNVRSWHAGEAPLLCRQEQPRPRVRVVPLCPVRAASSRGGLDSRIRCSSAHAGWNGPCMELQKQASSFHPITPPCSPPLTPTSCQRAPTHVGRPASPAANKPRHAPPPPAPPEPPSAPMHPACIRYVELKTLQDPPCPVPAHPFRVRPQLWIGDSGSTPVGSTGVAVWGPTRNEVHLARLRLPGRPYVHEPHNAAFAPLYRPHQRAPVLVLVTLFVSHELGGWPAGAEMA